MSNSPLVSYTKISPNSSSRNGQRIRKITPHHMSGNLSVETCGNVFAPTARQASSNYGIGSDGRIGMYVEEKDRAWTSSNAANDREAVTIEVANSICGGDWPISDAAWDSLVELCVDICKRNDIPELVWTADSNGTLTMHKMFASTDCPGTYLERRMPDLAAVVNARLSTKPNKKGRKRKMECIFRPNDENYLVYYDGVNAHRLAHPDEVTAIQKVYTACTGENIPMFELGSQAAPWATRFLDVVKRGI